MKSPMNPKLDRVAGGTLVFVLFTLFGCARLPTVPSVLTAVPVALNASTTIEATETAAMGIIDAALSATPSNENTPPNGQTMTAEANAAIIASALAEQTPSPTATPNQTALMAQQSAEQTAIAATLTAIVPTATATPLPDLAATATAVAAKLATAIAATLTARPQDTATPDQAATAAALKAQMETAIAATLTAQPTATPDWAATQTSQAHFFETAVAATLTAQPTPIPPPTNTPVPPPPAAPPPAAPPPSGIFRGNVTPVCTGERNMTWFEGTVYINNQPANGYQIAFKSYLVPGTDPATTPAISGPHAGYANWPNGYYAHIVNDYFAKKHLEIWIMNDARQAISDRVHWDSDGPDGPCNKAVINFFQ